MLGRKSACTGIDLGSTSIKVVRGIGASGRLRVTHVGLTELSDPSPRSSEQTSTALKELLSDLKLHKGGLGRVAVGVRGDGVSVREVLLPAMRRDEVERALPFEAKRHLFLDGMESPLFSFQILGETAPEAEGEAPQMRTLLAAVAKPKRDYVLGVLRGVGLEPEVIDVDALANANALMAGHAASVNSGSVGVLDLGKSNAELCLAHADGGVLMRVVGPGAPDREGSRPSDAYPLELAASVQETVTYYRGRHRKEVETICLAGGGALIPDLAEVLSEHAGTTVSVMNPLVNDRSSIVSGDLLVDESGSRFVTAYGLCHRFAGRQ